MTRPVPAPPPPVRPRRRRRGGSLLAVALAAVVVLVTALFVVADHRTVDGNGVAFARDAYAPQPQRVAEWTGNPGVRLSDEQIDKLATNAGIEVMPKFAAGFNLADQFADTARLMAAAKAKGNPLKVFAYFSASYWFNANVAGWGRYAQSFRPEWLLTDATGSAIPYYGTHGQRPLGSLLDLRNPQLRAWMVSTVVSWMHAAPFAGVAFDSANPLLPAVALRRGVGSADGLPQSYASLMCAGSGSGCTEVDEWNAGLEDLIQSTTDALHTMGKQVVYNGIAPSEQREGRNLDTLEHADIATNEAFCVYKKGDTHDSEGDVRIEPTSIAADAAVMRDAAAQDKSILEITNYGVSRYESIGDYCLAGFLMGWQPGHSWWVFHSSYDDPLDGTFPQPAETNLNLGDPTGAYRADGGLLSRSFEHGFVAVNTGASDASVRMPVRSIPFSDRVPGAIIAAGTRITLPPHSTVFALSTAYLNG